MINKTVYSLGHSNIGLEEFISFLQELEVRYLVDVRSDPVSSHVPHFNKSGLEKVLEARGIHYIYMGKDLGGRQGIPYREHVKSLHYITGIEEVKRIIANGVSAIMCGERDHTGCHRRYICETLLDNGYDVVQVKCDKEKNVSKQISLHTVEGDNGR